MLNPNLACILGELNCFRGFWLLFLSNLIIFHKKLGSKIFQNNAIAKVLRTLRLFSTQEHGTPIKLLLLLLVLQENKIRSIW